jgi:hypothetical protein
MSPSDSPLDSSDAPKQERMPFLRLVMWSVIGLALIVGIVLFIRYSRLMTALL